MNNLTVSLIQQTIIEDQPKENLQITYNKLLSLKGKTDVAILPELFTTGFALKNLNLAETNYGETLNQIKKWASSLQMAIVGSFLATDGGSYYNRAFFITPNEEAFFYDKRHLFPLGKEGKMLTTGDQSNTIITYKGWNIKLLVCYDLRFPVWSRNSNSAYDLLIYVSNWPTARNLAWETLLRARAIENQAYVIGVNRIGTDGNKIEHHGNSCIYTPQGSLSAVAQLNTEEILNDTLYIDKVKEFREKYPFWKDADTFTLTD